MQWYVVNSLCSYFVKEIKLYYIIGVHLGNLCELK